MNDCSEASRTPTRARIAMIEELTTYPLGVRHRSRRGTLAASVPERLERRPLPGRRSAPLLPADAGPVSRRSGLPVLRRLRSFAQPEQGSRRRPLQRPARSLVRPLPEGRRLLAELERRSADHDLSRLGGLRRSVQIGGLGRSPAREIRFQSAGTQTIEHGTIAEEQVPTTTGSVFDPIVGPKMGKTVCSLGTQPLTTPRTANYRPGSRRRRGGYTLMGSPTIIADRRSRRARTRRSPHASSTSRRKAPRP